MVSNMFHHWTLTVNSFSVHSNWQCYILSIYSCGRSDKTTYKIHGIDKKGKIPAGDGGVGEMGGGGEAGRGVKLVLAKLYITSN